VLFLKSGRKAAISMLSSIPLSKDQFMLPLYALRDVAIKNGQEQDGLQKMTGTIIDMAYTYLYKDN
jgi:hypothetical protein